MKSQFSWYLQPSADELASIWEKGILTVDANVLLDFYRYHVQTRENLLAAIESFGDRIWLSNQAATEFFRNRTTVIASAEKTFREAQSALQDLSNKLDGSVGTLRNHRLLPRPSLDQLHENIATAIDEVREAIKKTQSDHPNYFENDPILQRLLNIFDGRVGNPIAPEKFSDLVVEGEARRIAKVPPGYLDDDKDGDRKYGDFILWREALDHAKATSTPLILVTSERKDDWWEKQSGKTIGPRSELLKESLEYSGVRILIYQTDSFLHAISEKSGTVVDADAVEDIRAVSESRARRAREAAVRVSQKVEEAGLFENSGFLEIELLRPVYMLTGSGALSPALDSVPSMEIEVISFPSGAPEVRAWAGTGTNFDFNVHLKAARKGELLPIGTYVVRYKADAWAEFLDSLDDLPSNPPE